MQVTEKKIKFTKLEIKQKCLMIKFRCNNCDECCQTDASGVFNKRGIVPCEHLENGARLIES